MPKMNGENARALHNYFEFLAQAKGRSSASIDAAAKAIARFQKAAKSRDFKKLNRRQIIAFKDRLVEQANLRTGERLSKSTVTSTLRELRAFFEWLAREPGYRSRIVFSDIQYFNATERDLTVARAKRTKKVPTIDQLHHTIKHMAVDTIFERRDRAMIALALLTGARDGALVSLKLKHIDLEEGMVSFDGREVDTKFGKSFTTWFFPVGGEALAIVTAWIDELRAVFLWGEDDPVFPATQMGRGENGNFIPVGLARHGWSGTSPIRRIFRRAFDRAGLPYFNPHVFRDMLARYGLKVCSSHEAYKAWSQNLGHSNMLTTLTSYGEVPAHRQAELIRDLVATQDDNPKRDKLDEIHRLISSIAGERVTQ